MAINSEFIFLSVFKYLNSWEGAWGALIDYCLGRQIARGRLCLRGVSCEEVLHKCLFILETYYIARLKNYNSEALLAQSRPK